MERIFKYYPEDFGKLTVKVLHMDLDFNVFDDHTEVTSSFKAVALADISLLEMNAKKLEIESVSCDSRDVEHEYNEKEDKLIIRFKKALKKNEEFVITTKTVCKPTKNILEGLYFDETPDGAPPTQITQCQQWGFQRIVPCIDDMTVKCTYRSTITADKKYTNIITNGDVVAEREDVGDEREKITYSNEITPMSSYLFFLGVGTYDTFEREFEYPDDSTFMLELLAPPGSDKTVANNALEVLFDSIMWIHLFTGPDKYKNSEKSKKIMLLVKEREKGKDVRAKLKEMIAGMTLGYKYTGTVYREIGMQNSDFGGMENVGNTTITANRLMPYPEMTDGAFEYLTKVKVHEFYHNLNGSEVTGWSPFEIWLNEAVTVFIEREYHDYMWGTDYSRLGDVQDLLAPNGVFMQDESVASMPIEPDGFNDPNELISHITYIKAPEFVRMIQTLIGKEKFVQGLHLYHSRFKHSNATRKQWLESMEEASGMKLMDMAHAWLKKIHFPKVEAKTNYADNKFTISLEQINAHEKDFWEFPFSVALFDKDGKIIAERTERVNAKKFDIIFSDVEKPAFVSLNRDYSFYGKVLYKESEEELLLKLRKDNDIINRYMAYYELMDREKTRLIENPESEVRKEIIDLYFELISDDKLMIDAGAQFLANFEFVEDKRYAHKYQLLYDVKKKILEAIAKKYEKELKEIYNKYSKGIDTKDYLHDVVVNIKRRQLKNVCLGILSTLETPEIHSLIKKQFDEAENITDRISAFSAYINSKAPDKLQVLDDYEKVAKNNIVLWEIFLHVISRNDSDDALDIIKRIEKSDTFRIEQTNDQRGLFVSFSYNKKKSLLTEKGREFLEHSILKLSEINEYTTLQLLEIFANLDKMDEDTHVPLMGILVKVLKEVDKEKYPSVYNTTKRIISKLPKAVKSYENKFDKI